MTAEIFLKQVVFEEKRKVTASWALHILSCSPPAGGSPCTRWSLRGARAVGWTQTPNGQPQGSPPTADVAARGCALSLGVGDGQAWRGGDGSLQRPRAEIRKPTPSSEEVAAQGPRAELGSREARWLWATEVGSRPGRGRASSQGRRPPLGPALPCPSCLAPWRPCARRGGPGAAHASSGFFPQPARHPAWAASAPWPAPLSHARLLGGLLNPCASKSEGPGRQAVGSGGERPPSRRGSRPARLVAVWPPRGVRARTRE